MLSISVQQDDFDYAAEYQLLRQNQGQAGAIVSFCGLVRDFDDGKGKNLILEHYPGMTEKALENIAEQAQLRWPVIDIRIIHRIGTLAISDQIVFVGVSSAHREAAFAACEFIMDYLKTQAPFWKQAETESKRYWVEAKQKDCDALQKWQSKHGAAS